jgi:myo-inositol-1(or 4)-monophosphatase
MAARKLTSQKAHKREVTQPARNARPAKADRSKTERNGKRRAAATATPPKQKATPSAKPAVRTTPPPPPAPRRKAAAEAPVKMLPRDLLMDLATRIRDAVAPAVRAVRGREVVGAASSGDATFEIDRIAEKALLVFLRELKQPIAYYSEDAGYTTFNGGAPKSLLIIDPIDGTRAAKNGFEGCVVSVASTRVIERPRIADIDNALVMEILGDRVFYAERGKGARIYANGAGKKPKLSSNTDLERMAWAMTVPARPAELIFPTAAKLIDLTSLKGGFFACNSTSYSLTRLLTNQLDACVDFANRYLRDIPDAVKDQFINAGRGIILGIAPYDIAASVLIAQEAGAIVTDAYGGSLDDVLLLDSSVGNHRSLIAAANKELHEKLMSFFDTRINQYERLLKRRAELLN